MGPRSRIHTAVFIFMAGLMPQNPMLGSSLLQVQSHLVSTNWFKSSVFQTDKENQKCAGGAHSKRTVSTVPVDPTSFSWWWFSCLVLRLLGGFKDVLTKPMATNNTVAALDIGVLLRLPKLDVFEPNIRFLSPRHQLPTDILWAIIN